MKKTGLYKGGSHASGNDIPVIIDGHKKVRTEGNEYLLCRTVFENTKVYDFKDFTNKKMLDAFHKEGHCHFDQSKASSGDFIITKSAVLDRKKYTIKGTIRDIVDNMQRLHGGRTSNDSVVLVDGGGIDCGGCLDGGGKLKETTFVEPIKNNNMKKEKTRLELITSNIKAFIPIHQLEVIANGMRGEEEQYFKDTLINIDKVISEMPKTYETENIPFNDKKVYLHYFNSGSDWYIFEKDMEQGQLQAYGYVVLNNDFQNSESGYINIEEITKIKGVELDLHWKIEPISEVLKKAGHPEYKVEIEKQETAKDETAVAEYAKLTYLLAKALKTDNKTYIRNLVGEIFALVEKNPFLYPEYLANIITLPKAYRYGTEIYGGDEHNKYITDWLKEHKKNQFELLPIKQYNLPKYKPFETKHNDKVFMDIHTEFTSDDTLRVSMLGTNFNEEGVTTTDAHLLLFTQYVGKHGVKYGNFCHSKKCFGDEENVENAKYPNWKAVIPIDFTHKVNIDVTALHSFLKNTIDFGLINKYTHKVCVEYTDILIAFNAEFLLKSIDAMLKLGHNELEFGLISPTRAAVIYPKGKSGKLKNHETDFVLTMPVMKGEEDGDLVYKLETNCCYFQGNEKEYCFDTVVLEKESFKKKIKDEVSESVKAEKETLVNKFSIEKIADKLMNIDGSVWDKLNIQSGSSLYSDIDLQIKYKHELDKRISAAKIKFPLDFKIHEILEDENSHSLNSYLYLSGAYGEEKRKEWIDYVDKHKNLTLIVTFYLREEEIPKPESTENEVAEAIYFIKELLPDLKGKAKKEAKEAINLLNDLLPAKPKKGKKSKK